MDETPELPFLDLLNRNYDAKQLKELLKEALGFSKGQSVELLKGIVFECETVLSAVNELCEELGLPKPSILRDKSPKDEGLDNMTKVKKLKNLGASKETALGLGQG